MHIHGQNRQQLRAGSQPVFKKKSKFEKKLQIFRKLFIYPEYFKEIKQK
jgi:hypothetical protein